MRTNKQTHKPTNKQNSTSTDNKGPLKLALANQQTLSVSRRTRRAWSAFICGAIGLYGLWLDRQLQQTTDVRRTDCLADETWDERIACSFDKRASRNPANTYIRRRVESLNLSLISHPTSRPFFAQFLLTIPSFPFLPLYFTEISSQQTSLCGHRSSFCERFNQIQWLLRSHSIRSRITRCPPVRLSIGSRRRFSQKTEGSIYTIHSTYYIIIFP